MKLPTLLSHALVAFTIEFDNEFEHSIPHRTARYGGASGPWLASMAMFLNCMQFVGDDGVHARELEALARTPTNLNGMERWGYLHVERSTKMIQATEKGRLAREVWKPLFGIIEKRWEDRFGKNQIEELRQALEAIVSQLDIKLPDCLPILGYGLVGKVSTRKNAPRDENHSLAALLAKVLLAFTLEFERESELSLAICANVLRMLNEEGVRVRDLPRVSGVSKEAIAVALGFLQKRGFAEVESRGAVRIAGLTPKGIAAKTECAGLLKAVEERWEKRFDLASLRKSLEPLTNERLISALEPHPDGWRASVPKPATLPHYPMVLHRGGYPDGS